jgi:hypothetical protein
MSEQTLSSFWPLLADFLGILALILGLYLLVLDLRKRANRYVGLMIFCLPLATLPSPLPSVRDAPKASLPFVIDAAIGPTIGPWLALAALVLLKPEWTQGRMRWLHHLLVALILLPGLLTVVDVLFKTNLYYPGLEAQVYQGGYMSFADFVTGTFGRLIVILYLPVINGLVILPLAYFAFLDRSLAPDTRRLTRLLLGTQAVVAATYLSTQSLLSTGLPVLFTSFICTLAYFYAASQQMTSERRLQSTRLQTRLTSLTLVVTIPMMVLIALTLVTQAQESFEQNAFSHLETAGNNLSLSITHWLDENVRALQNLAAQPGIVSMDPQQQRPILQAFAVNYPYVYLVSTTDTSGINIARNDEETPKDYSDRSWFIEAVSGQPVVYQTLIGRTTGRPALVISVPIRDAGGQILGVAMFACELTDISAIVGQMSVGESSFAFLVDSNDQLLAHPDIQEGAAELVDYSQAEPVAALRSAATSAGQSVSALPTAIPRA